MTEEHKTCLEYDDIHMVCAYTNAECPYDDWNDASEWCELYCEG